MKGLIHDILNKRRGSSATKSTTNEVPTAMDLNIPSAASLLSAAVGNSHKRKSLDENVIQKHHKQLQQQLGNDFLVEIDKMETSASAQISPLNSSSNLFSSSFQSALNSPLSNSVAAAEKSPENKRNTISFDSNITITDINTNSLLLNLLIKSIQNNDFTSFESYRGDLRDAMNEKFSFQNINDCNLLFLSCFYNRLEFVKVILDIHIDAINYCTQGTHTTCLHLTCMKGFLDLGEYLIHMGADVQIKDASGNTPFHLALKNNHVEVANSLLLCDANLLDMKRYDGKTALHLACEIGALPQVQFYAQHYQQIKTFLIKDSKGNIPLFVCIKHDQMECFKFLYEHIYQHLNLKTLITETGGTLIHVCVEFNRLGMLHFLYQRNASAVNNILNDQERVMKRTALQFAVVLYTNFFHLFVCLNSGTGKESLWICTIFTWPGGH